MFRFVKIVIYGVLVSSRSNIGTGRFVINNGELISTVVKLTIVPLDAIHIFPSFVLSMVPLKFKANALRVFLHLDAVADR